MVSTRGFFGGGEADYVLLLIDGVRVGHGDTGLIDWSAFPLSAVRRVEVLRGPGASVYGDAAMGGVVQLFTDRQPARGQLSGTWGSSATGTVEGVLSRGRDTAVTAAGGMKRTAGALTHSAAGASSPSMERLQPRGGDGRCRRIGSTAITPARSGVPANRPSTHRTQPTVSTHSIDWNERTR